MISALRRKLGGDKDGTTNLIMPPGVSRVNNELQKKYARGVQYNMKIVIRGDRNVGKTCLLKRLQGLSFCEEYVPTEEIQVVNIHWNYKATDDVIKVDVWDIVDQSTKKKIKNDKLKLSNNSQAHPTDETLEDANCDARFVDVYKGAHGVVLMFDLTKLWTWEYVQKEICHIPTNIPVIILANRRDMGHHRVVTDDMCDSFVDNFNKDVSFMSFNCMPMVMPDQYNVSCVNLSVIIRHSIASVLYIIAICHFPGLASAKWTENYSFMKNLDVVMFVLSFWCAFIFHYLISAGRVEMDVRTGRGMGKGWIVKHSRRAHRVFLSLALAISAAALLHSTVIVLIVNHFSIQDSHADGMPLLILLKVDQSVSLFLFVIALGRLVFEPIGIPKRNRDCSKRLELTLQQPGSTSDSSEGTEEESDVCNICDSKWTNRKLSCGHLICCCCLLNIWKVASTVPTCPYCRREINTIRELSVMVKGKVEIHDCCQNMIESSNGAHCPQYKEEQSFGLVSPPAPLESTNNMSDGSPRVRWTQSSMRNAFGLRLVHLFFNIPFLCLQRETLKLQIERNRQEIVSSYSELDCYRESAEADYEKFMEAVTQKRRQTAENQGVKASAVTPSGRVMGGGQPIPGQSLSPEKSVRKPSDASIAESTENISATVQKSSPEHQESRKDSFEMLGGEEVDDMNQFLDSNEMAEKSKRPASLPLNQSSISDEENNTMVRTFEEDFYADDDLNEKMSKKAVEQKKTKKTSVLKLQELPPPSITPPAYHVRLESDNADSSNDEYITPERTDSDVPNNFTALSSPSEQKTLENVISESNPTSTAFTAEDLDEWLGKEDGPILTNVEQRAGLESSDDEIGVKPPVLTPTQPIVSVPQTVQMIIPNLKTEEKPKKKKKKTVEGSSEKKKSKDTTSKTKKRSSSKSGRNTMKTPQVTLEEFLGGPIVQDDQDYDPL